MNLKSFSTIASIFMLALLVMLLPSTSGAAAQRPAADGTVSYSGRLNNNANQPVTDGTYAFTFTLYNAAGGGNLLWSEIQTGVVVKGGVFTVPLGSSTPLPTQAHISQGWLAVSVRGPNETDFTALSPRQPLNTAAPASSSSLASGPACAHDHFGASWSGDSTGTPANAGLRVEDFAETGTGIVGVADSQESFAGVYGESRAGAGVHGESSELGNGVEGVSVSGLGVKGTSGSSYGVSGNSTSNYGVYGNSTSSTGVYGHSTNGNGVYGGSTNGNGVYGHATNSATGVYGDSSSGIGVGGFSSSGNGVYGQSSSGFAMFAEGDAHQTQDAGGWVKAMALVNGTSILRCYNSQTSGASVSTPPCGFSSSGSSGVYVVDFGFYVVDRFFSITPEMGIHGIVSAAVDSFPTVNQVKVRLNADSPFFIIIY